MIGFVYLVGAGPGDPDLLTLKAVKAIGRADVILVDDLVADGILAHASPAARIVPVGNRVSLVESSLGGAAKQDLLPIGIPRQPFDSPEVTGEY